jgi:hypothetical protein
MCACTRCTTLFCATIILIAFAFSWMLQDLAVAGHLQVITEN